MNWLLITFVRGHGVIVFTGCPAGNPTQVAVNWKDRGIFAPV